MTRGAATVALALLAAAAVAVSATAKPPKRAYTAAGNATAKAIAIKRSDLPAGWKAIGNVGGVGVTCPTFDPDQSDLTTIGHADAGFGTADGAGNVASVVGIFKSASQAQKSWNRLVRPQLLGCMARFVESTATKGTTVKVVSKGKLAVPVPGKRKAAYRIVANFSGGGQQAKIYLDLILQGRGAADTVLIITAVVTPPSKSLEAALAKAIGRRLPK
jgi:hypothetical protein